MSFHSYVDVVALCIPVSHPPKQLAKATLSRVSPANSQSKDIGVSSNRDEVDLNVEKTLSCILTNNSS